MKYVDYDGLLYFWTLLKPKFVAVVDGKALSTNDYTTAEKTKLAGIAENANNYSLPTATASVLGGVTVGDNITLSSGKISLSKTNVVTALGYTPPVSDTTYSAATTTAAGLMSSADKTKLDGIDTNANKYVLPTSTASVLGGVKIGSNITVSSGTISLVKANVTAALGYTPMTPTEVSTAIAGAGHLKRTIVTALPDVTAADADTIYMILEDTASTDNKYIEWMVINSAWEKVGTSDVDLTPYAKTADLVRVTNTEIDTILAS